MPVLRRSWTFQNIFLLCSRFPLHIEATIVWLRPTVTFRLRPLLNILRLLAKKQGHYHTQLTRGSYRDQEIASPVEAQ
jgi:hypothetical protein